MKKSLLSAVALTAMVAFGGTAWADIVIGVGGPLTGPNAAFGAQLQKGAEQAAADINAAGGINGEQIKIVLGDDVSDPKQGISVANKFVADGVKYVVGHFNSGVSIPASEVYAENGILEVTPAATNPVFTERGMWNTFRTCGRDDQQGGVAGKYLAREVQGQQDRHHRRQDPLWSGPCRRNQEGDERCRRHRSRSRSRQCRRQGLLGPRRQDEGSRRLDHLLGRSAHRSRPDHPPGEGPGPEGNPRFG